VAANGIDHRVILRACILSLYVGLFLVDFDFFGRVGIELRAL
jgi:hypothetical protein